MLYQLLSPRPQVIDTIVSAERWSDAMFGRDRPLEWSVEEVTNALLTFVAHQPDNQKLLLFVDDLDEQCGTEEERRLTLILSQLLPRTDRCKLCVSSRAWNVYVDAFEHCPRSRPENLKQNDLSTYFRDNLGKNKHFRRHAQARPGLLQTPIDQIVTMARGI
jgi:hypothetical protein